MGSCHKIDGWELIGYETYGGGDGLGLNFIIILLGFIDEVETPVCTLVSIKKGGIYVGCSETVGDGFNGNGEVHDRKYGMRLPIKAPKLLLLIALE